MYMQTLRVVDDFATNHAIFMDYTHRNCTTFDPESSFYPMRPTILRDVFHYVNTMPAPSPYAGAVDVFQYQPPDGPDHKNTTLTVYLHADTNVVVLYRYEGYETLSNVFQHVQDSVWYSQYRKQDKADWPSDFFSIKCPFQ